MTGTAKREVGAAIARLRGVHTLVTEVPDCPNCGEGPPFCDHEPVTCCENCQNEDNGPCDVLVLVAALQAADESSNAEEGRR